MNISTKLLKAAAGSAGGAGLDVDEVFSTFVADATGSGSLTINNGIDLSGEGGIVWVKSRNNAHNHYIFDTNVGSGGYLIPNSSTVGLTGANYSFTSTGLTDAYNNYSGNEAVWWTFRKAPKFFDVVTYTGNGANRTIAHSLDSVPGMIIIKRLDNNNPWCIFHRSTGNTGFINFDTNGFSTVSNFMNNTSPTSTNFALGTRDDVNNSGNTYVAYLFAHNDGDGEFGPDGDQDIISCGSVNANSTFTLPWQPQWILSKDYNRSGDWHIIDSMRGFTATGNADNYLEANNANAEQTAGWFNIDGNTLKNRSLRYYHLC